MTITRRGFLSASAAFAATPVLGGRAWGAPLPREADIVVIGAGAAAENVKPAPGVTGSRLVPVVRQIGEKNVALTIAAGLGLYLIATRKRALEWAMHFLSRRHRARCRQLSRYDSDLRDASANLTACGRGRLVLVPPLETMSLSLMRSYSSHTWPSQCRT